MGDCLQGVIVKVVFEVFQFTSFIRSLFASQRWRQARAFNPSAARNNGGSLQQAAAISLWNG